MGNRGRPRHGRQSAKGTGSAADGSYGASAPTGDTQEPRGGDGTRAGRPATGGRAERRRQARRIKRRRRRSYIKEIPILIGVALAIALVLKTFLVQAFVIPSGSMEQTIKIGDRVLVDKLTPWFGSKPERGDVVVFKDPGKWLKDEQHQPADDGGAFQPVKDAMTSIGLLPSADEQDLIKRVVAVGGDTVKCCDKQGRVTVNGTPLTEPYVHPGNPPSQLKFTVNVPTGRIFVMGDHRSNSADSRFHLDEPYRGTVSEDSVVGRAVVIAWPFSHWRRLEEPDTFATVHDAPGARASAAGAPHRVSPESLTVLPTPAELPLVMGVVGLRRLTGGRVRGVRSRCGGLGGRRAVRNRRARGAGRGR
ncbi:signal peptidase I [Streptomyces inhibens]|uniref:signal peptidase I n=1 Tax=Streptomyces inhibens TaxID=2293571 RepID=UPI001EE6ABF4|nr:signal peptidase I [Streptomyces inhibens]UKY52942.1 signal peptidase I [Streptomyces inhibens]